MKRFGTRSRTLRITNFSAAVFVSILSFNTLYAHAVAREADLNCTVETSNFSTLSNGMIDFTNSNDLTREKTLADLTIVPTAASTVTLTTATIGATITDPLIGVLDRGVVWNTTSGVTIADHKTSEGDHTTGSYSVNVTGLDRSKTIYYRGYYTDQYGTVLSDELSFSNVPVFSGTGNWNDATKWNVQEVPGISAGDSIIIDGNCTIQDLTIDLGTKVTINAGNTLTVTGTLVNNAGVSGLVIKSDPLKTNGTLTFQNGSPVATVEMYSKASWDLYQTGGSIYSWQFFGIPVKTFSMTDEFSNSFIRKYNENSTVDGDLWVYQTSQTPLNSGIGYEIVQQGPVTYHFSGELTNAGFNQTLDYIPGTSFPGQTILGNPYTSAIDITAIGFDANTEHSVYLYNTGTYNQWLDNSNNTYNGITSAPGQYTVSTPNTAGVSGVPAQIPSMQGFLVKTLNQANGSISIPYNGGVVPNVEPQRAPQANKSVTTNKIVTRINLAGTHSADCLWVFTDPACSNKFDNGWDGYKMKGSIQAPQLYAVEADGDYQIDAVADINGTNLAFNAGQDSVFKLTFTHTNTDVRYTGLYLVDLTENKTIDITANGSEYSFTAVSTPTPVQRFKIVTSSQVSTSTIPVNSSLVKVFNSKGSLFVQNQSDQVGNLTLYNMDGVAVKKALFQANDITTFSTSNLVPGAYVAKACTNQQMVTERIIIR